MFKWLKQLKKKRGAFGLIEVLIAIAVSGVVMLGAVQVSARTLKQIKENELRDTASGVLLQSLEIARSPVDFRLTKLLGPSSQRKFRLGNIIGDTTQSLNLIETNYQGDVTTCSESAEIRLTTEDPNFIICNLITVNDVTTATDKAKGIKRVFEIKSDTAYFLGTQQFVDQLITYRTEIISESDVLPTVKPAAPTTSPTPLGLTPTRIIIGPTNPSF